jgi:hypothetical protein
MVVRTVSHSPDDGENGTIRYPAGGDIVNPWTVQLATTLESKNGPTT